MEKENEIMQFQSIILMLMYIERIDKCTEFRYKLSTEGEK